MMPFLLLDLARICISGFIETESSSNNINDTLINPDRWMKRAAWIFWYLFSFLQPSDASIPAIVVRGQRLRQSSLTRLSNEVDSAGAKAWAECLC